MRILMIRHGDPDYEHDSLTETGKKEAALLAEIRRVLRPHGILYVNDFLVNTDERNLLRMIPKNFSGLIRIPERKGRGSRPGSSGI